MSVALSTVGIGTIANSGILLLTAYFNSRGRDRINKKVDASVAKVEQVHNEVKTSNGTTIGEAVEHVAKVIIPDKMGPS
jgi:hypothetical protein